MMHYYGYGGNYLWGGFFNAIFMIVFWVALIYFIIWLARADRKDNAQRGDRAMDILKERYARGEISKEEFEEKKKEIMES